jgi:5-methylcytosine-specific restriction endonuclease McrA
MGAQAPRRRAFLLLSRLMRKVLVLNTTYEPLNVCTVRRALVLLLKEKAEVLEQSGQVYHSGHDAHELPHVIRLRSYVPLPRRRGSSRISRRAIFARDQHRCQYCGSDRHLTVDHVVPRCKGGLDTWDNLVTSCAPCNRKKGDRAPQHAGLSLARTPRPPAPASFVFLHVDRIHDSWRPYLAFAAS